MKYSHTVPVKVIVIGAGGTGGYVIPHLYRIGYASGRPMRVIVCDGDVVEEKNLIRQNFVSTGLSLSMCLFRKRVILREWPNAPFPGILCYSKRVSWICSRDKFTNGSIPKR